MGTPARWRFWHKKGVNSVFLNQFGISGLLETWITPHERYETFLCSFSLYLFSIRPYSTSCRLTSDSIAEKGKRKTAGKPFSTLTGKEGGEGKEIPVIWLSEDHKKYQKQHGRVWPHSDQIRWHNDQCILCGSVVSTQLGEYHCLVCELGLNSARFPAVGLRVFLLPCWSQRDLRLRFYESYVCFDFFSFFFFWKALRPAPLQPKCTAYTQN